MEKLYELHSEGGFDLVVVDTPPTRHALDFVDAPRRLYSFLENRVFRLVLMPTRVYMKAMTFAAHALLRTISRVAGSEIVEDAMAFFRAFEGMEEGFRSGHAVSRTCWRIRVRPSCSWWRRGRTRSTRRVSSPTPS